MVKIKINISKQTLSKMVLADDIHLFSDAKQFSINFAIVIFSLAFHWDSLKKIYSFFFHQFIEEVVLY